ncbi:MAG: hypothetical protein H7Z19_13135 [Chitinophagaceae bacterium]|nr:hypothetical protein [Rubrivivax sp.]
MSKIVRTASLSLALLITAASALAATKTSPPPDAAQAQYQKERAKCLDGTSNQDRATCLKEAGAALAEARRGALTAEQGNLERNARERCEPLPVAERSACLARMRGQGTTSGSAQSGGVSRELREVVTEPVPPAASAPQPKP